jgi:hypothetical protein
MAKKNPRESFQAMLDKTREERPDLFDPPGCIVVPEWVLEAEANGDIVEFSPITPADIRKIKDGTTQAGARKVDMKRLMTDDEYFLEIIGQAALDEVAAALEEHDGG